jgi:hypothetical protein
VPHKLIVLCGNVINVMDTILHGGLGMPLYPEALCYCRPYFCNKK